MDFENLVALAHSSIEKQNIPEAINLLEKALKKIQILMISVIN